MGRAFAMAGVCAVGAFVAQACMSRPLVSTEPHTSNLYVEPIHTEVVDKIDLLFMIDNSSSMGDKQQLLAQAVPQLVDRLVVPRCVGPTGDVKKRASAAEACPSGYAEEFRAVKDIHIGVISSSLGAHGATNPIGGCSGGSPANDRALLLPKARPSLALTSYADSGFLAWDPNQKLTPPGANDSTRLGQDFGALVSAADQEGCGYEASLESWYRFLIDPEPPQSVSVVDRRAVAGPPDQELLAQRAAFLRPDSLVAIVMLTDENDCSIRDDQFGYLLAENTAEIPRATAACEKDPNDRCCFACTAVGQFPDGCPVPDADVACMRSKTLVASQTAGPNQTPRNLRCLQNKRRFGYDFLYPTSRYIDGLTQLQVPRRSDGVMVDNPLFAKVPGKPRRDKRLVFLAGIVGVPWQDIADEASLPGAGLRYLTARELHDANRWDVIVGDPAKNQPPSDPFMLEQTEPRSGQNPITGISIAPATSLDPQANPINGHEQVDVDGTDLQYACTFKLPQPLPCDDATGSCDCHVSSSPTDKGDDGPRNRALCQAPGGGAPSSTQYYGKAYPGLRPLEVLRGIGDSAIVASICPKVLDSNQPFITRTVSGSTRRIGALQAAP